MAPSSERTVMRGWLAPRTLEDALRRRRSGHSRRSPLELKLDSTWIGCTLKQLPSGTEAVRPFLPARDFELSKRFYEALGFRKLLEGDVVIFEVGGTSFLLQKHYEKNWAENFMMQLATCHKTPDGSATYAMRSPQGCSAGGRGGATLSRFFVGVRAWRSYL